DNGLADRLDRLLALVRVSTGKRDQPCMHPLPLSMVVAGDRMAVSDTRQGRATPPRASGGPGLWMASVAESRELRQKRLRTACGSRWQTSPVGRKRLG